MLSVITLIRQSLQQMTSPLIIQTMTYGLIVHLWWLTSTVYGDSLNQLIKCYQSCSGVLLLRHNGWNFFMWMLNLGSFKLDYCYWLLCFQLWISQLLLKMSTVYFLLTAKSHHLYKGLEKTNNSSSFFAILLDSQTKNTTSQKKN